MDAVAAEEQQQRKQDKKERKQQPRREGTAGGGKGGGGSKLRGLPKDSHEVRISKTLSWVLRHGAKSENLKMRSDGYARVDDLLALPKMHELDLASLEHIVQKDAKGRYSLVEEIDPLSGQSTRWIRANQGHSIAAVVIDLEPIPSHASIPTGVAVHGTSKRAWEFIKEQGLSRMKRNHIHLAQGVPGSGVISGMRNTSQIFVFIDVQKAINAGIAFYISDNGVILSAGDEQGFLKPDFFSRVETADRKPLPGWDAPEGVPQDPSKTIEGGFSITGASPHHSAPGQDDDLKPSATTQGAGVEDVAEKLSSMNV
ncbi:KptA family-domain-containing protein [Epithele typhae]|uniref:KptA family-domain-containing protein n=1 Tax=Epithele typhae TaxID=378194 RepID=UPI002008C4A8|nr:KptA family-domain-containing protein [Epithele typhae]KAH9940894.1 KptA family-domain-containing protein [Epithele typhae]